jgi:hypothetical protein
MSRELTDIREHDKKISDEAHDTHKDVKEFEKLIGNNFIFSFYFLA